MKSSSSSRRSERYPIPASETRVELRVVNSRFIATGAYAPSVDEARAFIDRMREEFADATHNVYAYVVGYGKSVIKGSTDDGEPSGTAGRPALAVLQGSGIGDVVVVVTRYFGGTKLGTGGLVRAYGDSVRALLQEMPTKEHVEISRFRVVVPYHLYEMCRRAVEGCEATVYAEDFGQDVTLEVGVPVDRVKRFKSSLSEISSGSVVPEAL